MKKIFLLLLTVLMTIGVTFSGFAANSFNNQYPEEVRSVLNREIFFVKNQAPQLYVSSVKDINRTTAYVGNWKFYQILNDENFNGADWSSVQADKNTSIVRFTGTPRISPKNSNVTVFFFVKKGAKSPIAAQLVMKESSGKESVIDTNKFTKMGMNQSMAIFANDAAISCMLTVFSDKGIKIVR